MSPSADKDKWIKAKFSGGEYEVTVDGCLISRNAYRGGSSRVLKTKIHPKTGYEQVVLWDKALKKSHCCLVHRIVALIHIDNPGLLPEVNHKDGVKSNNRVGNLEWCLEADNLRHAYASSLRSADGEMNGRAKLAESQVLEMRSLREAGASFDELGEKYEIHPMYAAAVCRGKTWRKL